jgi:hypothetical protein
MIPDRILDGAKRKIIVAWWNQRGIEFLAEAVYNGTQERFLKGWFPE